MPLPRLVRCFLGSAVVLGALTAAPAVNANDVFLQLDGIPGESADVAFRDQIVINTFTLGVTQSGNRAQFDSLTVTKRVDRSSPRLFQAAATGEVIKKAVLSTRKPGAGKNPPYYRLTLSDVVVSSVKISEGTELLESISFSFGKIEIEYLQQDASGQYRTPIKVGYDLKAARKI